MNSLQDYVSISFTLVFIAFTAMAVYLYSERDRVPEQFRTAVRVSAIYLFIAAINYYYMMNMYGAAQAAGQAQFPTSFRYIDWILTTPLMLIKFPLLLGVGEKGTRFMTRLVILDLIMIVCGYVGEVNQQGSLAVHWGFFVGGCAAWIAIAVQLFVALVDLPPQTSESVRAGIRTMGLFVVAGWAIYPLGYFSPLLGFPPDIRELVYNIADIINKCGLCLIVYVTAKRAAVELDSLPELADDAALA